MAAVLKQALDSEIGLKVTSNDVIKLRNRLYAARRALIQSGEEAYAKLTLRVSPGDQHEVWIIKEEKLNAQTENQLGDADEEGDGSPL